MAAPRTIVAAVDWSEESKYAFDWALSNICRGTDRLIPLHVGHKIDEGIFTSAKLLSELEAKEHEGRQAVIEHFVAAARTAQVPCDGKVVEGDARYEVCKAATESEAELLVLGSRGLGAIKRAWLGSVSDYCIHNADCPVLVVHKPKDGAAATPSADAKRRVVIAVDQSQHAAYSFRWACRELCRPNDQVIALHVRPPAYLRYPVAEMGMGEYYMPPDVIADMERSSAEAAEDMVRKFVNEAITDFKLTAEGFVFRGEARDTLCTEAERLAADVLVVGSRGLGAFSRTVLGSVSDYCTHHASCPVLVVKPPRAGNHASKERKN